MTNARFPSSSQPPSALVVGAGLAGCTMATLLAQSGWAVTVIERRSDPRAATSDAGRSINLAISRRGLDALDAVGCKEAALERAVAMSARLVHPEGGEVHRHPYGAAGQQIFSIQRSYLNHLLIDAADAEPLTTLEFDAKVESIDVDAPSVTLADGRVLAADMIVGADGAWSRVRRSLARGRRFDQSQSFLDHGYQELTVAAAADGSPRLRADGLHIWPRQDRMAIALPNDDGSFTVTTFWPFAGPHGYDSIKSAADLAARMGQDYPDLAPHLTSLEEDYATNPVGDLVTIKFDPWHFDGKVVLIGDASHAIVPFYGQGANAALEDCLLLTAALAAHPTDRSAALRAFSTSRKPDADALAELTLANFVEMRDLVDSPIFTARSKMERVLSERLGDRFQTRYQMVTFSRMPYADAQRRASTNERLIDAALAGGGLAVTAAAARTLWSAARAAIR